MPRRGPDLATPAPHLRAQIATVQVLVVILVVAFTASTLVGRTGFDPLLDGWLQAAGYVACAGLLVLRPALCPVDRRLWWLAAVALVLRAGAFVAHLGWVRRMDPVPYPSVADAGWLGMSVLLLAGLVGAGATRFRYVRSSLVLDGLVGAAATAAIALAVVPELLDDLSPAGTSRAALLVNGLYPLLDVALLLVVLGVLLAFQWSPPPAIWVLGVGVVGFAVVDVVYLQQLADGAYRPGTPLSALSLVCTAVIAFSGWAPPGSPRVERRDYLPGLVLPGLLSLTCLGVLLHAAFRPAPAASVLVAAVGLLAALARVGLSFRTLRRLAATWRESRTDALTGTADRRALHEALDRALRGRSRAHPLAVLVVDVDGFRDVNDSLGHHRGDELLKAVASRMQLAVSPGDVVARIGGDEFAVLLDGADAAAAAHTAEVLRARCRGPFVLGSLPHVVGLSVGMALYPDDSTEGDPLLQQAEDAMRVAKEERSGQGLFRDEHSRVAASTPSMTPTELRDALRSGQVVLHYQPKVDLRDGSVFGVEALVRWEHPVEGLLLPGAFLRLAESGGLVRELTLHVLSQALGQLALWRDQGIETTVAVNLSVSDLLDSRFPSQVTRLLAQHGVPGDALVLELTEDLLLADPTRGHRVIADLAARGVRVEVDDYGTGYSTLGYLRDLPSLSGLKLDKSFVAHLDTNPRSAAIVASTIDLAGSLGLQLIAEGVETAAVAQRLLDLGCYQAQGWWFSRAVPPGQVPFGQLPVAAP